MYVIRVKKAPKGAGELYTDADILEGYYVANAGEQVHLLGDKLINGYRIMAAFGDEELRKEMIKDGDNSFGMTVPVGGGVTLIAVLQQIVKPESIKPEYHVKYREQEKFDIWFPVN